VAIVAFLLASFQRVSIAQLFGMQETLSLQQACTSSQWISSAIIILAAYAGCTGFD